MPTPERVREMLGNCLIGLKEFSSPDYLPEFKALFKEQIRVLETTDDIGRPSFRDIGPQRHGEIVGEKQEG
jgi:hypothetical protein